MIHVQEMGRTGRPIRPGFGHSSIAPDSTAISMCRVLARWSTRPSLYACRAPWVVPFKSYEQEPRPRYRIDFLYGGRPHYADMPQRIPPGIAIVDI